jgi:hypothetical protein
MREGGGAAESQPMSTAVHRVFGHKDEILVFWLRGFVNNPGYIASFYIKLRDITCFGSKTTGFAN